MTEPDLFKASSLLKDSPEWVLFTHQKADGDTMGSASALFEAGMLAGRRISWFTPTPLPSGYRFLAHVEECQICEGAFPFKEGPLYVFLDCANETRSVKGFETREPGARFLNIDHHEDNTCFATLNCVDPSSSSTSELMFRILQAGGWELSKAAAESLYTGIWTDSGGFSFSNTSARTHRLAADLMELGAEPAWLDDLINQNRTPEGMALWGRAMSRIRLFGPRDCGSERGIFALAWLSQEDFAATGAEAGDTEGLPSSLMRLKGVRLAAFLTEQESGEVRISFRSRERIFGAADVARELGGGGHPRAAGATHPGPLDASLMDIPRLLEKRYAEWSAAH
ncbi:MAG: bifunctional oligoribonuclease/PAP phosphatase NrnA [Fretibacterium sp.]|nr:bifunctional oligoribonuclease/PAP phosphatase NrnA [Fretibacterium sp.]